MKQSRLNLLFPLILLLLFSSSCESGVDPPSAVTPFVTDTPSRQPPPSQPPILTPTPLPTQIITESTSPLDIFDGLRMSDLATRDYGGSGIVIGDVVRRERHFVQYEMSYESDGLRITGLIDIPISEGPFPVIIVNHGYLRPSEYQAGFDSWRIADWLAERGYIAVMPDYRNYGESDNGPNPFRIGYAVDVMNLIAQLDSLELAKSQQVGIIGHSMGGEISMWPMIISDEVDAVILYSSMSGDVARNWEHRWKYWSFQRNAMDAVGLIYGLPADNPDAYAAISPINYLDQIQMPVMIHHGTMDESVPFWWSEELAGLMEEAETDVTFWPYPGGTHTLGGRAFETFMGRNLAFFEQYVLVDINSP